MLCKVTRALYLNSLKYFRVKICIVGGAVGPTILLTFHKQDHMSNTKCLVKSMDQRPS